MRVNGGSGGAMMAMALVIFCLAAIIMRLLRLALAIGNLKRLQTQWACLVLVHHSWYLARRWFNWWYSGGGVGGPGVVFSLASSRLFSPWLRLVLLPKVVWPASKVHA